MTHHVSFLASFGAHRRPLLLIVVAILFCSLQFAFTAPLAAQDADTMVYTVQAGETLSEIAAQFGVDPQVVLDLNGLEDADAIFVGQTLRVPVEVDSTQPAPAGTHRIQPGETLGSIAQSYGMTVEELLALNQLNDADAVYAGQLLAIGDATGVPDASNSSDEVTNAPDEPIEVETRGKVGIELWEEKREESSVGNGLLSHAADRILPWALAGLTAGFEKGPGGPPPL